MGSFHAFGCYGDNLIKNRCNWALSVKEIAEVSRGR